MIKEILFFVALLLYAYPLGFFLSSLVLRRILRFINPANTERMGGIKINMRHEGFWIGLCEHFIIVTFILANQYTALGLVFAARGIVRSKSIKKDPSYYLVGMLLNFCLAVIFAISTKMILLLLHNPLIALFG